MMNRKLREENVLQHEGQILAVCGRGTKEEAIEVAECLIDGAVNALLRMQEPDEVAKFTFALSDRVVARARRPTFVPGTLSLAPSEVPAVIEIKPTPPKPAPNRWRKLWNETFFIWLLGFAAGYLCGRGR